MSQAAAPAASSPTGRERRRFARRWSRGLDVSLGVAAIGVYLLVMVDTNRLTFAAGLDRQQPLDSAIPRTASYAADPALPPLHPLIADVGVQAKQDAQQQHTTVASSPRPRTTSPATAAPAPVVAPIPSATAKGNGNGQNGSHGKKGSPAPGP